MEKLLQIKDNLDRVKISIQETPENINLYRVKNIWETKYLETLIELNINDDDIG